MSNPFDDIDIEGADWTEVLGELVRGGSTDQSAQAVLGAMFNAKANPAYKQALARRAAMSRPTTYSAGPTKARDFALGFTIYGTVGQTLTVSQTPQCLFRPEKLVVQEIGSSTNGIGTSITQAFVGQRNQLPVNSGGALSSAAFAPGALGNGIKFDTCQPAIAIAFQISFLQTCTWMGTLFGKAVLN